MENPSLRASMVAMLLPCTYSIAAQNWPSISPAPYTLVMFGLLRTLVASASVDSACSRACGVLAEGAQLDRFQGDGLSALQVIGFIDNASWRFRQFTQNFEVADFRRHSFLLQSIAAVSFFATKLRRHTHRG